MKCKKHQRYKAKRKPTGDCKECWLIWKARERERRAIESFFGIPHDNCVECRTAK